MLLGLGLDSALRMNGCSSKWHSVIKNVSLCLLWFLLVCAIFSETLQGEPEQHDDIIFDYIGVSPAVQTQLSPVELQCIIQPYITSMNASVNITYPNKEYDVSSMNWSSNGKFIFSSSFSAIGKYSFVVTISDDEKIVAKSASYFFWIAHSRDDTDSDSMPDHWEKKYGLNITNPYDADVDEDNDGISNAMEYTLGSNPLKNQMIINTKYRLQQQSDYFLFSFLCFLIISFFSLFGVQRGSAWL